MHAIEKELTKKLKTKAAEDEDRQEFLARLVREVGAFGDSEWEKLSPAAQDWANDATKEFKAKKKITDFADEDEDEKPTRKAAPKEGKESKKRDTGEGGMSAMMFIRHYLADNPEATVDEVAKALEKSSFKVPSTVTIATMRSEFRNVCRVLAGKNVFKQGITLGKG
jgi:hypothetical protein